MTGPLFSQGRLFPEVQAGLVGLAQGGGGCGCGCGGGLRKWVGGGGVPWNQSRGEVIGGRRTGSVVFILLEGSVGFIIIACIR